MDGKKKGYWFIFREMTWASWKAICLVAPIFSLLMIYSLSTTDDNDDTLIELLTAAAGMAFFGVILFYPLIVVINLFISSNEKSPSGPIRIVVFSEGFIIDFNKFLLLLSSQ